MGGFTDFPLDALAQGPRINLLYTQITLCFETADRMKGSDKIKKQQDKIIAHLTEGLAQLATHFHWIAGKVINQRGVFSIIPVRTAEAFTVQEWVNYGEKVKRELNKAEVLEHEAWPYDWADLKMARFPFRMLHENNIAARPTLSSESELADGLPVFVVQANFVCGGLLLTMQGQHGAMDMTGLSQVMQLFAKAANGTTFTPEEIDTGNMSRNVVPLLSGADDEEAKGEATPDGKRPEDGGDQTDVVAPGKLVWAYLSFSKSSLRNLKSKSQGLVVQGSFVSTDDVLSAFVWQQITRARMPRLRDVGKMRTTLSRNVDVRQALNLPVPYPGLLVQSTECSMSVKELLEQPLGAIAMNLRAKLEPTALAQQTRLAATRISRREPVTSHGASCPALNVRLSSWAKEGCYDLDFGFGKPVAVRRPAFTDGAREGLVYFMPKDLDGSIVVGVCLGEEDMDRLRNSAWLRLYAQYIG